jgi:CRP-like cAMP-binding protein
MQQRRALTTPRLASEYGQSVSRTPHPQRFAQLVLEWCASGHQTQRGVSFTIPLTHEEIGDCIGHSRETVSRTLADLKHRNLVDIHGSTLIVPSSIALQRHAYKSQKRKMSTDTADPFESAWPAA